MMTSTWPPSLRDEPGMVYAYARLLKWPIWLGSEQVDPDRIVHATAGRQNPVLATDCSAFDAVTVPYVVGSNALMTIERKGAVPSLRAGRSTFTLLVAPGSGRSVADLPDVQVLAGEEARIELPPTVGLMWDTPP